MSTKRLNLTLAPEDWKHLEAEAGRRNETLATVAREAIRLHRSLKEAKDAGRSVVVDDGERWLQVLLP